MKKQVLNYRVVFLFLFSFLSLFACAQPSYQEFASGEDCFNQTSGQTNILRNIEIKLRKRTILASDNAEDSKFLNKSEVENIFRSEINSYLQNHAENNIYCDMAINYYRMFMMFTTTVFIGSAVNGYEIICHQNNQIILHKNNKKRHKSNLKFNEKASRFAKTISFSYGKEYEVLEVKNLARIIGEESSNFLTEKLK